MSLTGVADHARLSVLLDLRHPLAYLALQPALDLGEELALEIDWLPLSVPPLHPPTVEAPGDDRGIWHRRHRARAIRREIDTYAAARGLVLRDPYRGDPVEAANLGWLWLREGAPALLPTYLKELFRRYWCREFDAASPRAVAALLAEGGIDAGGFLAWAEGPGPRAADDVAAALRDRGLFQVPAYVVDDEVVYGRQHLPMIRWILGGRAGPVPI
jgi:2-hydroxychromene-2-carboxylate isomerase